MCKNIRLGRYEFGDTMTPRVIRPAYVPIPQNLSYPKWKIEVIAASDGVTYDVTDFVSNGTINRRSTTSLSNFALSIDNGNGRYRDKFNAGDIFNFYYDYTQGALTEIKFRGKLDGAFDNFNIDEGFFISIEGRDFPEFADTGITIGFSNANVLDAFRGTSGNQDSQGNFSNGLLNGSGIIMRVYDPTSSTWKDYKDLSDAERTALKSQSVYDKNVIDSFEDRARLTISSQIAKDSDLKWRLFFDPSDELWYIYVHPEEGVKNTTERGILGQNLFNIDRFGKDTKKEANRVKIIGDVDSNVVRFRTKSDTARQSVLWIKDFVEQVTDLNTDELVEARATATLNIKKEEDKIGNFTSACMTSLQPGEKVAFAIPHIFNGDLIVDSFNIQFGVGVGLISSLDIKEKEEEVPDIFKTLLNNQINVLPTNNPNAMTDSQVFDFSNEDDYVLRSGVSITNDVLNGNGIATTVEKDLGYNISQFVLRIISADTLSCTYRISNDGGDTFEDYTLGTLHSFSSTGSKIILEITLAGTNPQYNKIDLLTKK